LSDLLAESLEEVGGGGELGGHSQGRWHWSSEGSGEGSESELGGGGEGHRRRSRGESQRSRGSEAESNLGRGSKGHRSRGSSHWQRSRSSEGHWGRSSHGNGQGSGNGSSKGHWSWSHWVGHGVVDAVGIEAGGIGSHHTGSGHRSSHGSSQRSSEWSSQRSRSMEGQETSLGGGHAEGNELEIKVYSKYLVSTLIHPLILSRSSPTHHNLGEHFAWFWGWVG